MAVTVQRTADNRTVRIQIMGRFDFRAHAEFRDAYRKTGQPGDRYVVDLDRTEYLDSSALGMLLLLREAAGDDSAHVEIINCRPGIRRIFTIARFEQLFTIA